METDHGSDFEQSDGDFDADLRHFRDREPELTGRGYRRGQHDASGSRDRGGSRGDGRGRGAHFDPLFLSNSDNPGMQLAVVPFDGSNFQCWSRAIKLALGSKMKLGFVDGTFPRLDRYSRDYDRWEHCDNMVLSWILNSMVKDLSQNFMFVRSAEHLWSELQEQYAELNAPLIYQLQKEINDIRQEDSSVSVYYGRLKKAWEELQAVEGTPICTCGAIDRCSCMWMKRILEKEATNRLMQFLMGLNDAYDTVRSTIQSSDPLLGVTHAFQTVVRIERQKGITSNMAQSHDVLAVNRFGGQNRGFGKTSQLQQNNSLGRTSQLQQNNGSSAYGNNPNGYGRNTHDRENKKTKFERKCEFCQEPGHVKETCFKLVGYSEWWKGPRSQVDQGRVMANVQEMGGYGTPLDIEEGVSDTKPNPSLVNAVFQEMVKAMKGKGTIEDGGSIGQSNINFAGPYN